MRWHLLFGFLFFASLLAIQPTAGQTTAAAENWNPYSTGFYPPIPTSARQTGWTYGTSSGDSGINSGSANDVNIVATPSPTGSITGNTLTYAGHSLGADNNNPSLNYIGPKLTFPSSVSCSGDTSKDFQFDFYITSFVSSAGFANGFYVIELGNAVDGSRLYIQIGNPDGGAIIGGITTTTGASASTTIGGGMGANQWWHFDLFGLACASFEGFYLVYSQVGTSTSYSGTVGIASDLAGSITPPSIFRVRSHLQSNNVAGTRSFGTSYFENLDFDLSSTGAGEGALFCPDAYVSEPSGTGDSPNYGYTYRRGGGFFDQSDTDLTGVGLSTGFLYEGNTATESTWDYSAKGLTAGTHAAHQNITMEAATDTVSSNFRVAFMTNTGATPDATSKGNGVNTGNFANHAEAQFIEAGNTWQVGIYYVTAGGSKTQIGSSVNYGHSNDATDFTVYLDTRAANPFIAVRGSTGQILSSNGTAANAEAFRTAFSGDPIFDFWLIGAGSSGLATPATAIDENQQHDLDNTDDEGGHDSTCIFDDEGVGVVLGTSGVAPGSSIEQPPTDPDEPDDPAHLDFGSTAANLVAGALFIIVMALLAIEKGAGNVGIGAIVIGALFLAHVLGWIPLGYLLMLMVLCVAALWFLPSFGGGGREEKAGGF